MFELPDAVLYVGDCREVLRSLRAESVHCVVTSPPYWGLRDYGLAPVVWGGLPECAHEWGDERRETATDHEGWLWTDGQAHGGKQAARWGLSRGADCLLCSAWRGVLGLEPEPTCWAWATGVECGRCYTCHIVEVFREVRRVLRADATCWVNLGDSYASQGGHTGQGASSHRQGRANGPEQNRGSYSSVAPSLKPKDLVGIPWLVAFALRADGWYLRSDIIWAKPNPMPESVPDRSTKAHEYLFLLAKSER